MVGGGGGALIRRGRLFNNFSLRGALIRRGGAYLKLGANSSIYGNLKNMSDLLEKRQE